MRLVYDKNLRFRRLFLNWEIQAGAIPGWGQLKSNSNSNVMLDLGYDLKELEAQGVVLTCNTAYRAIQDKRFNSSFSRVLPYECFENPVGKSERCAKLVQQLRTAINEVFSL